MEEWFSRFFQDLQLQLGLRDPKLTAPEKNISGIFLETDTGENIDILLVGKDGCVEELRGRTPTEELVRFASLDFAEYHAVIQRLWTEHPLFLERMDVPYSDYEDFEKQISDLPDWIMKIDTISAFYASEHLQDAMAMQDNGSPIFPSEKGAAVLRALDEPCGAQLRIRNLLEIGFADYERAAQWERYGALEEAYPHWCTSSFLAGRCRSDTGCGIRLKTTLSCTCWNCSFISARRKSVSHGVSAAGSISFRKPLRKRTTATV